MGKVKLDSVRLKLIYKEWEQEHVLEDYRLDYLLLRDHASALVRDKQGDPAFQLEYFSPEGDGAILRLDPDFCLYKRDVLEGPYQGVLVVLISPADQVIIDMQRQIRELQLGLRRLEEQVQALRQGQGQGQAQEEPVLSLKTRKTSLTSEKPLDIAILYSDPLVSMRPNGQVVPQPEPVSYRAEIDRLRSLFMRSPVSIRCQVATLQNLGHLVYRSPQVLHIICHGTVKKNDHYSLSFQSHEHIGALIELTGEILRQTYDRRHLRQPIKVIFVNACHSGQLAQIFMKEVKADYAVAVESRERIEDQTALVFSYNFYSNLLNGNSVPVAFDLAKTLTRNEMNTERSCCCCSHSHLPGCLFRAFQEQFGERTGHELFHVPPRSSCLHCTQKASGVHRSSCKWARETLRKINAAYASSDESQFSKYNEIRLCCCARQEDMPEHEQTRKFRLLVREGLDREVRLQLSEDAAFEDETGPQLQSWYCQHNRDSFIGRNLELEKMARTLRGGTGKGQQRVVLLTGPGGSGKTELGRRAAEYVIQRGGYPNGLIEIDFGQCSTVASFHFKITQPFENFKLEEALEHYRQRSCLFLFDNLDLLFLSKGQHFLETLRGLVDSQPNSKFILLCKQSTLDQVLPRDCLNGLGLGELVIALAPLREDYAAKLLLLQGKDYLQSKYYDLKVLARHPIFTVIDRYPKTILDLAQFLSRSLSRSRVSLDSYLDKLRTEAESENKRRTEQSYFRKKNIALLKESDPEALDLLLMLAQFAGGLSFGDLRIMGESDSGFIPSQWRTTLLRLISFDGGQQRKLGSQSECGRELLESVPNGSFYFVIKEERGSEKFFKVQPQIKESLEQEEGQAFEVKERHFIMFINFYLSYLLEQFRECKYHHEGLIQLNHFTHCGFWGIRPELPAYDHCFGYYGRRRDEAKHMSESVSRWKRVEAVVKIHEKQYNVTYDRQFLRHQQNFLRITQKKIKLLGENGIERETKLVGAIENILLSIPTLFLLLERTILAESTVLMATSFLRKLEETFAQKQVHNPSLLLSLCKLSLLEHSIRLRQDPSACSKVDNLFKESAAYLKSFEKGDIVAVTFRLEYLFLKGCLLLESVQARKSPEEGKQLRAVLSDFLEESRGLEVVPDNLKLLMAKQKILRFRAQGVLRLAEDRKKSLGQSLLGVDNLLPTIDLLEEQGLLQLSLQSIVDLVHSGFEDPAEPNPRALKKLILRAKELLKPQFRISNPELLRKFAFLQREVDSRIAHSIEHLVCFLRSELCPGAEFIPAFGLWRNFDNFKHLSKQLTLKNEVLNKDGLSQALAEGSHVLALTFLGDPFDGQGHLQLDECLLPERLALEQMLPEEQHSCEILIVCSLEADRVAQFFIQKLSPSVIVELKLVPGEQPPRLVQKFLQAKAIDCFTLRLVEYFYGGADLEQAYEKAVSETTLLVMKSSRKEVRSKADFERRVGSFRMRVLKGNAAEILCESKGGKFHNLTKRRPKKNFEAVCPFLAGQQELLLQVLKVLQAGSGVGYINFFGKGVARAGRTPFCLQLGSLLWEREAFKDGIFVLQGKNYRCDCFKEFIEGELGFGINQLIREGLDLRLCLLFEDFQLIAKHCERDNLLQFVLQRLAQNRVSIFMLTPTRLKPTPGVLSTLPLNYLELKDTNNSMTLHVLQKVLLEKDQGGEVRLQQMVRINEKKVPLREKVLQLERKIERLRRKRDRQHWSLSKERDQFIEEGLVDGRVESEEIEEEELQGPPRIEFKRAKPK